MTRLHGSCSPGRAISLSRLSPSTSTLACSLIPYVGYSLAVYGFTLPLFMKTGALGLVKSFAFALIIVGITALLGKMRIKLKI